MNSANTGCSANAGSMLGQRRRRWTSIEPALTPCLLGRFFSLLYILPPGPDLFVRVPFQLHGGHTFLQPFRRIELIVHIAIFVLPGTDLHMSRVKHMRRETLYYFSENHAPSGARNRTTGSEIDKATRSNHWRTWCTWLILQCSCHVLGFVFG